MDDNTVKLWAVSLSRLGSLEITVDQPHETPHNEERICEAPNDNPTTYLTISVVAKHLAKGNRRTHDLVMVAQQAKLEAIMKRPLCRVHDLERRPPLAGATPLLTASTTAIVVEPLR